MVAATATARARTNNQPSKSSMQAAGSTFEVDGSGAAAAAASSPLLAPPPTSRTPRKASASTSSAAAAAAGVLDRYSHPLVVPSDKAFMALLIAPLLVWWVAVLAGAWVYEGLPKGQRVYHVMMWFDKGILRPAGPLVPFAVVIARAVVHGLEHRLSLRRNGSITASGPAAAAKRRHQQQQQGVGADGGAGGGLQLGSLLVNCLTVYAAMAVARLAIYLTHYFLLSQRYLEFHIVSDHIFLAATMLICLQTEVVCLMSDLVRVESRLAACSTNGSRQRSSSSSSSSNNSVSVSEVLLALLLVLALFLYLFTAADMYYTAKYYHFPLESVTTTVLVFVLFQCPMLVWIIRRRRVGHASRG